MAVTADATGTQTATIGTEHTLRDNATAGTYTLHVDTVNMAAGDVLQLGVYQIVLTAGTRRGAYNGRWTEAQPADPFGDLIKVSVPISNELTDSGSLRFTLLQSKGTGRSYPWKVLKHA